MDTEPTRDPNQATPEPLAYSYAAPPPSVGNRRKTWVRVGVAGGIAALGLTAGGIAVATADDDGRAGPGERGLFRAGGLLGEDLAERLAEELGVDQDEVEDALDDVREEYGPEFRDKFRDRFREDREQGERPAPPTEAEIEERQDAFATALAEALDVDKADVEAALEEINADFQAALEERLADVREEARADLVERLDAAVEDGTLTEADEASVLKAYDEGVIGGPGGLMMGGGPFDLGGPMGGHFGGGMSDGDDEQPSTNS
ncbi:hypothetical protein [Nocardioides bigeumensis]|uniref:Uncharacterized protein n=1 Tax=Nocardioides bigeumensis TaxID=433657 RepID=A0ABP5KJP8_9ACTN